MQRVSGFTAGEVAIDLGAGTGKFTRALVDLGAVVTAIEPIDEMRAQLSQSLPKVNALSGVTQHLPVEDGSADLVTCAQSFHWFASEESVTEIARVLKPGHCLILVWNQRDLANPIQHKLGEILDHYQDPNIPHSPSRRWQPVIDDSPLFSFVEEARFTNTHELPRDGVVDRLRSMSIFSQLSEEIQAKELGELEALIPDTEMVAMPYFNESFAYRRVS
jgi:SAM-dependent methyltransferase